MFYLMSLYFIVVLFVFSIMFPQRKTLARIIFITPNAIVNHSDYLYFKFYINTYVFVVMSNSYSILTFHQEKI